LAASVAAMFLVLCLPAETSRGDAQGKIMATDETGQDPKLPPDARLESLEERLERLQETEAKRTGRATPNPTTRVWQLMFSHLVGAPAGGGIIGWGLDSLAGLAGYRTFPLFFLLMLFVGFGVGVVNVMRISKTPPGGSPGAGS
jgi:ATP synthase protein I